MSITWSNNLTGKLREMERQSKNTGPLMSALAKELDVAFREHFRKLESKGNKQGWPARHFWTREVMRMQTFKSDDTRALLEIASPAYLHKITGGIIRPKKGSALAIPQNAKAYALGGPKASGLQMHFAFAPRGKVIGYLIADQVKMKGGKNMRGVIMYALVRSVNQAAMPDALPNQAELEGRIIERIQAWLPTLAKL